MISIELKEDDEKNRIEPTKKTRLFLYQPNN